MTPSPATSPPWQIIEPDVAAALARSAEPLELLALDEGTRRALERQAQKADCSAEDLAAALIALMLHQFALVAPDARRAARRARA